MPASSANRSARLDLPYLLPAQARKHVTHNEPLLRLDQAFFRNTCRPDVKEDDRSEPPRKVQSTDAGHSGRTTLSRDEGAVVFSCCRWPTGDRVSRMSGTKPVTIEKREIWEAFHYVDGNQGVDRQTLESFGERLGPNLHKF